MVKVTSRDDLVLALRKGLPVALPEFLMQRRWFGGKSRAIKTVRVRDVVPVDLPDNAQACICLIEIEYAGGAADTYSLPFVTASGHDDTTAPSIRLIADAEEIVLHDALADRSFQEFLLDKIRNEQRLPGEQGEIWATHTGALHTLAACEADNLAPLLMRAEQSNTSIVYGKRLVFKWFRRLEEGLNPDVEIGTFLTEKTGFRNVPLVAGSMEYRGGGQPMTLGLLQAYVANQGDAWEFTLKMLAQYYADASAASMLAPPQEPLLNLAERAIPEEAKQRIGPYLDCAALLGIRTAELHLALASGSDPAFAAEPSDAHCQHELGLAASELMSRVFQSLADRVAGLPQDTQEKARSLLAAEPKLRQIFTKFESSSISAMRTRIHGDYHLGQVLYTGEDFVIIDFEGEPARSLQERRKKRSPLQDVAGMLRSFEYAAYAPLLMDSPALANFHKDPEERLALFEPQAAYWKAWVSAAYLRAYLEKAGTAAFVPQTRAKLGLLLDFYVLDKALYEVGYELNSRPSWLPIPVNGITRLLGIGQ
jgi:maltose alpha-D-glucosyltransferase / alpha-amylase